MLSQSDIQKRNNQLVDFLYKAGLTDFAVWNFSNPNIPKLYSTNYELQYCCYVKNFRIIFEKDSVILTEFDINVFKKSDHQQKNEIGQHFLSLLLKTIHNRVYTIRDSQNDELLVCGFNHKDKINKLHPYPVFAKQDPIIYYEKEKAKDVASSFEGVQVY